MATEEELKRMDEALERARALSGRSCGPVAVAQTSACGTRQSFSAFRTSACSSSCGADARAQWATERRPGT